MSNMKRNMPAQGLKLNFLNNPAQRLAAGKGLPVHKLEAIIIYGTQVQRIKVLKKMLPQAFHLSLHAETYKVIITLLTHCDNTIKTELLYAIRRKFLELSRTKNGNLVAQKLIETCPAQQKKEIAEMFVVGADEDELLDMGTHIFGNRVLSKLCEYSMCVEALEGVLLPAIPQLACHQHGQHVITRLIESSEAGADLVVKSLFPSGKPEDTATCEEILEKLPETTVLVSLLASNNVVSDVKESLVMLAQANVDEYLNPENAAADVEKDDDDDEDEFKETSFTGGKKVAPSAAAGAEKNPVKHTHFIAAAIEHGSDQDLNDFSKLLKPYLSQMASEKNQSRVLVQLYKRACLGSGKEAAALRKSLIAATINLAEEKTITAAAAAPAASLFLRIAVANDLSDFATKGSASIPELIKASFELAPTPCGSPVLQALASSHPDRASAIAKVLLAKGQSDFVEVSKTIGGSILLQQLIEHAAGERDAIISTLLSSAPEVKKAVATTRGTFRTKKQQLAAGAGSKRKERDDEDEDDKEEEVFLTNAEEAEAEAAKMVGIFSLPDVAFTMPGSRLLQKIIAYCDDEVLQSRIINLFIVPVKNAEGLNRPTLSSRAVALDKHGCYVLQALIPAMKIRAMEDDRKTIVDQLKRCVFDLAIYPWSGRVVLDTIFEVASETLKNAIKEVIFLKTENALSAVPDINKDQGANHKSMMRAVNEGNKRAGEGGDASNSNNSGAEKKRVRKEDAGDDAPQGGDDSAEKKRKPAKKAYRSLKK